MTLPVRLTLETLQEIARSRGGECLSEGPVNWDTTLRWRCQQGHEWENRAGKIKSGQWCPTCAGKSPKGLAFLQELARQKGGTCLSTVYPGMQGTVRWRCAEGHEWEAKPNNIRYGGWCPHCLGRRQTIEDMRELARSRGGECLSDEYLGQAKKLTWKCADNHVWRAVPNSIKNGNWCPKCHIHYGEEICRRYFEALFGKPFPKTKPDFLLVGPRAARELDGYCAELNLAFEHHGLQHYQRVPRFQPTEEDFQGQLQRDRDKIKRCRVAGITLIDIPAIPEITTLEELSGVVQGRLAAAGITPPNDIDFSTLDLSGIYDHSVLRELQEIARSRGGELLSDIYLGDREPLWWRCQAGHEWLSRPNNIKAGKWCALCYGNVRKTLEEVRAAAELRGITLVSEEYKGANTVHTWRCSQGHDWETTPSKILILGTGCPHCAGLIRTLDDMRAIATARGGKCLSTEYQNSATPLQWRCAQGHEFSLTPNYIQQRGGEWCPGCREAERRRIRVEARMAALNQVVTERGGRVVSGEYRDPHSKFVFECGHGHQWTTVYDSVTRGSWCRQCYLAKRQPEAKQSTTD